MEQKEMPASKAGGGKERFKALGWKIFTVAVLALTAVITLKVYASFTEPAAAPADSDQDFAQNIMGANNADNDFDSSLVAANADGSIIERLQYIANNYGAYGRGWIASTTDSHATTSLTQATCEATSDWKWFEDGNGDGDTSDPEDGICVQVANLGSDSCWNGDCATSNFENSYIAGYSCAGSFPNGYVVTGVGNYAGYDSVGGADTAYNDGNCALCKADCYDGRKDLPDQGAWTTHNNAELNGTQGPLTPEVLKNWKGTRLPTMNDFYGFCGATTTASESTAGDGFYYSSGASASTTVGRYGQNVGRGLNGPPYDEYINLSDHSSAYEWLAEQYLYNNAMYAGGYACSRTANTNVYYYRTVRAVFRP